jgi:simple sugar transport system ATP-binding protein
VQAETLLAVLELRKISKNFGAITALTDVDLAIQPGEVLGLMGDNGAGKSTLVKIIAGNFPPSSGELMVDGEPTRFSKPVEAARKASRSSTKISRCATTLRPHPTFSSAARSPAASARSRSQLPRHVRRAAELFGELKSETARATGSPMSGGSAGSGHRPHPPVATPRSC